MRTVGSLNLLANIEKEKENNYSVLGAGEAVELENKYSDILEKLSQEMMLQRLRNQILTQKVDGIDERLVQLESSNREGEKDYNLKVLLDETDSFVNRKELTENNAKKVSLFDSVVELLQQNYEAEDIQEQISLCAKIISRIISILKNIPKESGNYRRQLILLLHSALKRNYASIQFSAEQITLLKDLAQKCNESYIDEEMYFYYDEQLYIEELEVMPLEE